MKKEVEQLVKKTASDLANKPISRKEAIKKTGYMAVSAATMMLLLNRPAQAGPQCSPVHSGGGDHDRDRNRDKGKKGGGQGSGIWGD